MDDIVVNFGDVFRFREKEYVFLGATDEIVYTALILDKEKSEMVKKQLDRPKNPEKVRNNRAYCFVELRTEKFRDRVAHLGMSGEDETANSSKLYFNIEGRVDNEDLRKSKVRF